MMMSGPTGYIYIDCSRESIAAFTGWCGLRFRMHFLEGEVRNDDHPSALSGLLYVYSSLVGCRFWRHRFIYDSYDMFWSKFVVLSWPAVYSCPLNTRHARRHCLICSVLFSTILMIWYDWKQRKRKISMWDVSKLTHDMWHSHSIGTAWPSGSCYRHTHR